MKTGTSPEGQMGACPARESVQRTCQIVTPPDNSSSPLHTTWKMPPLSRSLFTFSRRCGLFALGRPLIPHVEAQGTDARLRQVCFGIPMQGAQQHDLVVPGAGEIGRQHQGAVEGRQRFVIPL